MEVSDDIDKSGFSGTLDESLIDNIRENEKKEVETVSIETVLRKSAITGNQKWEIGIVLPRERFLF